MNTIDNVKLLKFSELGDDDKGHLVVIEGGTNVPFEIKRVFYIYDSSNDVIRGQHANRNSEFCLINVSGTSKVRVVDQKGNEKILTLNQPHTGINIPTMIWKDMYDFSQDSILLVLSNKHYDASEYIKDYDAFIGGGRL